MNIEIPEYAGKEDKLIQVSEALEQIKERMNPKQLYIEAQCYATGYYEREGFRVCSMRK